MSGLVFLESHRIVPRDLDSDTVVMFMHPIGGGAFLPFVQALARAGMHVIYCNSRYRGNDSALIMEKVVVDLGEAIADAKRRFGYERVVLAGWSGGGSLSLFYQQQARRPTVTATPAGDPPDLTALDLQPADAMMLVAAHPSRHRVLVDSLDPSIADEARPDDREVDARPVRPATARSHRTTPSSSNASAAAQRARNRRITAWVEEQLASAARRGTARTTSAASWCAGRWPIRAGSIRAIDPNQRIPGV